MIGRRLWVAVPSPRVSSDVKDVHLIELVVTARGVTGFSQSERTKTLHIEAANPKDEYRDIIPESRVRNYLTPEAAFSSLWECIEPFPDFIGNAKPDFIRNCLRHHCPETQLQPADDEALEVSE